MLRGTLSRKRKGTRGVAGSTPNRQHDEGEEWEKGRRDPEEERRAKEHPPSEEKKEVKAEDGGPVPENSHKCCGYHFPLLIALLQLLLRVAITAMVTISPSLLARETPHLAGILLLYFILCAMGLVLSSLVMAFFGHHYTQTNGFSCMEVGDDCVCTLNPHDPIPRTFPYAEVSNCGEVTGTLKL